MGIRNRLVAATMTGLMLTAAVGTTAAAEPAASEHSTDKDLLAKVAAGLKVTVRQLTTALANLKQALAKGTDKAQAVAAFAGELKVSVADAEKALRALPGDKPGTPEEAIKLLVKELGISVDRARQVVKDLDQVKAKGDAALKDPVFIAIANGLGITPEHLLNTLIKVKQQIGKSEGKPGVPEEAVKLLAAELKISLERAKQVIRDLDKVRTKGDAALKDPAFIAIANGLGITPEHLLNTLIKVKQQIGKGEEKPTGAQ